MWLEIQTKLPWSSGTGELENSQGNISFSPKRAPIKSIRPPTTDGGLKVCIPESQEDLRNFLKQKRKPQRLPPGALNQT